tara:strand:+ start:427 stop:624 length:198 start_codon:yes stop_codon:yes gene_type:complete
MNITNTTKEIIDENEDDTTIVIVIIVFVTVVCFCYYCNRNKKKDAEDMARRAERAQGRLEIRYGK